MFRLALLALGWFFAALAVAGAILPLLPATPFVLLAAACFSRSSSAAYRRLLHSRLLGPILADWRAHRGLRPRTKRLLFGLAATFAAVTLALGGSTPITQAAALLSVALTAAILLLAPTIRPSPPVSTAPAARRPSLGHAKPKPRVTC